jgi:MFS superfamily sulfate permease-like transporter
MATKPDETMVEPPDIPDDMPGDAAISSTMYAQARQRLSDSIASARTLGPSRRHVAADLIAGLTFASVNVPQGLAYALMAGVNPVFGLYTLMIATPIAALFTSSVFMNVSSTSALSASMSDVLIA